MSEHTLEVHAIPGSATEGNARDILFTGLEDAIDLAADQDQMTWLTDHGKRIAAIVPVDVAEHHLAGLREVLTVLPANSQVRDIQLQFDKLAFDLNVAGVSQELLNRLAGLATAVRGALAVGQADRALT